MSEPTNTSLERRGFTIPWKLYGYILREHAGPFLFALVVTTLVLLLGQVFRMMELILTKGVPGKYALELFVLYLPAVLAYDVPMALMVGTLMAFGRLSADSEVTAMKATGTSFLKLMVPSIVMAVVFAVGMFLFNDQVLPEANHQFKNLLYDIQNKRPDINLRAGVFINDFPGYLIYIEDLDDRTMEMSGVRINMPRGGRLEKIVTAARGHIETGVGGVIRLYLEEGEIQIRPPGSAGFRILNFDDYTIEIDADTELKREERLLRSDREMTVAMMQDKVYEFETDRAILFKAAEIRKRELELGREPRERHKLLEALRLAFGGYTPEEVRRMYNLRGPVEPINFGESGEKQTGPPRLDFSDREPVEELSVPGSLEEGRGAEIGADFEQRPAPEREADSPAGEASGDSRYIDPLEQHLAILGESPRPTEDEDEASGDGGAETNDEEREVDSEPLLDPTGVFSPSVNPRDDAERTLTPAELVAREERYLATRGRTLQGQINKYDLEIAKKFSISFACISFVLVGAPLGVMIRRKGKGIGFVTSIGFFIFYWICLVAGEALGDRGVLHPWLAMWLPNLVFLGLGVLFIYRAVNDIGISSRGVVSAVLRFFTREGPIGRWLAKLRRRREKRLKSPPRT